MSSQAKSPRAPLSSLPPEILTSIALLLPDLSSIQSLALACRALNTCCERALWRDIRLSVHPHFGEIPSTFADEEATRDVSSWGVLRAQEAEQARRMEIRAKTKAVMNAANRRRWSMVERALLEVRLGAVNGFVQLLDNVTNLKSLEITSPGDGDYREEFEGLESESLDVRCIKAGLHFPFLSHIRITKRAIGHIGFIPLLCNSAPSLVSLNVDLRADLYEDWGSDEIHPASPEFERPTQIRHLRLSFPGWNGDEADDYIPPIADVLENSPYIEKLHIDCNGYYPSNNEITRCLLQIMDIQSLVWNITWLDLWVTLEDSLPHYHPTPFLWKKLVLTGAHWHNVFDELRGLPEVEQLYLIMPPEPTAQLKPPPTFTESAISQAMLPKFSKHLLACPRLRIIHTVHHDVDDGAFGVLRHIDEIGRSGSSNGLVRSFQHHPDPHELLHARFLSAYHELSDEIIRDAESHMPKDSRFEIGYTDEANAHRIKRFERRSYATWQDFTFYRDKVVPLEIIANMRKVEGVEEEAWQGRGIKVGKAAWQVLQDWAEKTVN